MLIVLKIIDNDVKYNGIVRRVGNIIVDYEKRG